jgi:hypothetical protein
MLVMLLACAQSASANPITFPADPGFGTGNAWTSTVSCGVLCSATGTQPATGGNPGGEARATFGTVATVLGSANGTVEFTSSAFTWSGDSPESAVLHLDRRTGLAGLRAVNGSAGAAVTLVDVTTATATTLASQTFTSDEPAWTGLDAAVPASLLVAGHTYNLKIRTTFTALVAVAGGAWVAYDNVSLAATRALPVVSGTAVGTPGTTTVRVGATVDAAGVDATCRVEYGTTTAYGSTTADAALAGAPGASPVGVDVTGLAPGTTYHARVVVTTDAGTTLGPDVTFTTAAPSDPVPPPAPMVGAATVTVQGARAAGVTALVDPNGLTGTEYRFEYGTTSAYATQTAIDAVPAAGANGWSVLSATLAALAPGTTYHVRAAVRDGATWTYGPDATFVTPAARAPEIGTPTVTVTETGAQVTAAITPHTSETTWHLEWGPTTAYGERSTLATMPAGADATVVRHDLAGLTPGSEYHFRFVATSEDGTTNGDDMALRTDATPAPPSPPSPPAPPAPPAPSVGATTVTVDGPRTARVSTPVEIAGRAGDFRLEYGVTAAYGTASPVTEIPAGAGRVTATLTGLRPATTYHVRTEVRVDGVWTDGPDGTFTTAEQDSRTVEDAPAEPATVTATPVTAPQVSAPAPPDAATGTTAGAPACRALRVLSRSRGVAVAMENFVTERAPLAITPSRKVRAVTRVVLDGRALATPVTGRTARLDVSVLREGTHRLVVGTGRHAARLRVAVRECTPWLAVRSAGGTSRVVLAAVPGTASATLALPRAKGRWLAAATLSVRADGRTRSMRMAGRKAFAAAPGMRVVRKGASVTVSGLPRDVTDVRITMKTATRLSPAGVWASVVAQERTRTMKARAIGGAAGRG